MRQVSIFERIGFDQRPGGLLDVCPVDDQPVPETWRDRFPPALTISQPWAALIASGEKWVENRIWSTTCRGPILIHAGSGKQYLPAHLLRQYTRGALVATAELVGCIHLDIAREKAAAGEGTNHFTAEQVAAIAGHKYSEGPFLWVLRNARPLEPIRMPGLQKLWRVKRQFQERIIEQRPEFGRLVG